jgi:ABC-type maltose transport system permease subunit
MNFFTIAVIALFFLASIVELANSRWLMAAFLALSGAINVVVWLMGR